MQQGRGLLAVDPARAPTWLLGEGPVQVWTVNEDRPFAASVLVRPGASIIMLASRLAGTDREGPEIRWAMRRIADGRRGYFEHERR